MAEKNKAFVFLDLDNTILDFSGAERRALSQALTEGGVTPTDKILRRYSEINLACWEELEKGNWTRAQVLLRRYERLIEEFSLCLDAQQLQRRYEQLLHTQHDILPGAGKLLRELYPHYALYLASNGTETVQRSRIAGAGIGGFFQDIFISECMGAVKPQREFFEACFARIPGFAPSRALMVGDSLSSDIQGGINAGIRTCWFNPAGKAAHGDIRADYEIRALSELPAILERLSLDSTRG